MLSFKIDRHESSDEGHDHLVLDLDDVLREGEDDGTLLSGEGDGVFRVEEVSLIGSVLLDQ